MLRAQKVCEIKESGGIAQLETKRHAKRIISAGMVSEIQVVNSGCLRTSKEGTCQECT